MPLIITHAELLAAKNAIDHVLSVVEEFGDGQDHQNAEPLRALLPKLCAYLAGTPGALQQSSVKIIVEDSLFTLPNDELLRRQGFKVGEHMSDEDWFSGTGRDA